MEDEEIETNKDGVFSSCQVCCVMDEEDIKILDEYIEQIVSQNQSLSSVMKSAFYFKDELENRRKQISGKTFRNGTIKSISQNDISKHILFCVACRSTNIRHIVCNTKAMQMLLESPTPSQTFSAIKLLQTSNNSAKLGAKDQ